MQDRVKITVSEELKNLLEIIKNESHVASLLLKGEFNQTDLVEDHVDYISLSSDNKKISYMTVDKMKRTEIDNYWAKTNRTMVKPGRFVSKLFKDISNRDVETFSTLFLSVINGRQLNFKVVKGDEIRSYYHYSTYNDNAGSLGSSCMKHDSCSEFFELYTKNDNISMLILLDDSDYLLGRAILWEDLKIMDRVYSVSDEKHLFHFKQYATEHGYLYKTHQNYLNTVTFENLKTDKQFLKLSTKLNIHNLDKYPYMDTFKFLGSDGELYNYPPKIDHRTLNCTDGSTYGRDTYGLDDIDQVLRNQGELVEVRYLNQRTTSNNTQWSNINNDYMLRSQCYFNEELNDYILNEEFDKFNNKEKINSILETRKRHNDFVNSRLESLWGINSKALQDISMDDLRKKVVNDFENYFGAVAV
jgi:hypothetical protein